MPVLEILGLLALVAGYWTWRDIIRAREAAVRVSRAACEAHGLLFLDETVAISSIWPARNEDGRLALRRVYTFEYSDTGDNRRPGYLTLLGEDVVALHLGERTA